MIAVAIVDDKRDIREGIQIILEQADDFSCTGIYPDAESAIDGIAKNAPDVVLMDIELPRMSGIEAVRVLKEENASLDILMFTVHHDNDSVFRSLKAGAYGYLTKNIFPSHLLNAIREVKEGGSPMSSSIARRVVSSFNDFKNPSPDLTKRELQVLNLLCQGQSYKVIAESLYVSPNTVRFHLKNIYKKLQVNSKYEAVIKASRRNLV